MKFPDIKTESPSGWEVRLPEAARGRVALIVVTMRPGQGEQAQSWLAPWLGEFGDKPSHTCYELKMVSGVWTEEEAAGAYGRAAARCPAAQGAGVLTHYGDPDPYAFLLGMVDAEVCHAFLLDKDGRIRLRGSGPADPGAAEAMLHAARDMAYPKAA